MLTTIHITVRDRVPTITAGEDVISHNSDYVAEFEFDEEWQDKVKTVYFVCEDGSYQAVVMSGNSCSVPMLDGEHRRIFVGVQSGAAEKPSILKTTRPCCLKVKDSIADYLGQPIPDPTPSVYEQIIAMLNNLTAPTWDSVQNKPFSTLGSGLSVDENGVLSAQGGGGSANAVQYVEQSLTAEQKAQARENIGAGTSSFSGSYNDLTSKPTIPTQVTIDSTLKQSGQAADAKAVGDTFDNVMQGFGEEIQNLVREFGKEFNTKLDKNQGTGNAGKILGIGADGIVVPQDKPTYTLPQATADALGGIKADAATAEDTQVVRIGADGKLRTKPTGGSSITVDSELSSTSVNPVQNKVVTAALAKKITAPTTAAVGQIVKVKSVDSTGKPTEWEATDLPSGGGRLTTIGKASMDGETTVVQWDLAGETTILVTIAGRTTAMGAKTATVKLSHASGATNGFYPLDLNASVYSPKNVMVIMGNGSSRMGIFVSSESMAYSGTIKSMVEQGITANNLPDDPATKITITFDTAPVSGTTVKVEGQ